MSKRTEKVAIQIAQLVGGGQQEAIKIAELLKQNFQENYLSASARTDSDKVVELDARTRASSEHVSRLMHAAMGIVTEAGEFMDTMKKHIRYGKELDKTNLLEELGDIQWYVALALRELKSNFNQIHAMNVAKLQMRFPEKFKAEEAINRDVLAERKLLDDQMMLSIDPAGMDPGDSRN